MGNDLKAFGETAKSLARNPLGIIALFIVMVYGLASLVRAFARSFTPGERVPLTYFLITFPVLVLGVFAWLGLQASTVASFSRRAISRMKRTTSGCKCRLSLHLRLRPRRAKLRPRRRDFTRLLRLSGPQAPPPFRGAMLGGIAFSGSMYSRDCLRSWRVTSTTCCLTAGHRP